MKFILIFVLCLLFSFQAKSSDYIKLKNGNRGTIFTLDTTGNLVTYSRNGNNVTIKKSLISFIVIGNDTISYDAFVPNDSIKHNWGKPIIRKYAHPIQTKKTPLFAEDQGPHLQVVQPVVKKSNKNNSSHILKGIGYLQISGAIVSEMIVVYDATRTQTISATVSGKTYSQSFQHEWTLGHTLFTLVNCMFLGSGIAFLTIDF